MNDIDRTPMTKAELIRLRDTAQNDGLRRAFRFAVNRIEALESDLREVNSMAKAILRIVQSSKNGND